MKKVRARLRALSSAPATNTTVGETKEDEKKENEKKKTILMRRSAEFEEGKCSVRGDAGSARAPATGESTGAQVRTLN